MQLATTFTADEIAFVNRVFEAMFDTYNTRRSEAMVITGIQAIQLAKGSSGDPSRRQSSNATQQTPAGASQSLSMTQAEAMMKRLVEEGWLEKSRRGYYSLSPRGLMELRGWLVATYNGENEDGNWVNKIKFCAACGEIITVVSCLSLCMTVTNMYRANGAVIAIVLAAFMIAACAVSSGFRGLRSVLSAALRGRGISLWAKGHLRRPSSLGRGIGEVPIHSLGALRDLARMVPRAMLSLDEYTVWGCYPS